MLWLLLTLPLFVGGQGNSTDTCCLSGWSIAGPITASGVGAFLAQVIIYTLIQLRPYLTPQVVSRSLVGLCCPCPPDPITKILPPDLPHDVFVSLTKISKRLRRHSKKIHDLADGISYETSCGTFTIRRYRDDEDLSPRHFHHPDFQNEFSNAFHRRVLLALRHDADKLEEEIALLISRLIREKRVLPYQRGDAMVYFFIGPAVPPVVMLVKPELGPDPVMVGETIRRHVSQVNCQQSTSSQEP